MRKVIEELSALKKNIDEAKIKIAQLDGREQETMKQLKDIYGLDSLAKAEKEIAYLEKEELRLAKEIENDYKKLKEDYEW